jgi:acetyltransferase-like isoleucine patch superfamily enzyme
VVLGQNCIIGKGVFIDSGVAVGNRVKIQNHVSIYHGVTIEDGVFVGPHVCFTNDLNPRAINVDGSLKTGADWLVSQTLVRYGASLGANSTIVCGVTIGTWAMVGAGSVVTRNVPAYGLVIGNPARLRGFVCPCGQRLTTTFDDPKKIEIWVQILCPVCQNVIEIPITDFKQQV